MTDDATDAFKRGAKVEDLRRDATPDPLAAWIAAARAALAAAKAAEDAHKAV